MRRGLFALPIPVFVLLAYNAVVLLGGDFVMRLHAVVFGASLASGAVFTLTTGELLILLGVVALFIEVVKATRSSMASAVDHALSALVFAVYLVEFLLVKAAGTGVFLVLTIMSFLDLIAGFTVTLGTARRVLPSSSRARSGWPTVGRCETPTSKLSSVCSFLLLYCRPVCQGHADAGSAPTGMVAEPTCAVSYLYEGGG
jgi:hypothetical protein